MLGCDQFPSDSDILILAQVISKPRNILIAKYAFITLHCLAS